VPVGFQHQALVDAHRGRPDRVGEARDPAEVASQPVRVEPRFVELGEGHPGLVPAGPAESRFAERLDLGVSGEPGRGDRETDPPFGGSGVRHLQLDQVPGGGSVALQHLFEQQGTHRLVEAVEVFGGEFGHRARVAGGAQQGQVVYDGEASVGHQPDVELEHVGAQLDRQVVGGEGVFRPVGGGAPVGDYQRFVGLRVHATIAPQVQGKAVQIR
jgi:hypothetical protein